jgi:hypothetical protein
MAIGIVEVDPSTTVISVDLSSSLAAGIGPIGDAALDDPPEHRIEFRLGDEKGVMLLLDRFVRLQIVERNVVIQRHHVKWPEARRSRSTEDLNEETRGFALVRAIYDCVVKLHGRGLHLT